MVRAPIVRKIIFGIVCEVRANKRKQQSLHSNRNLFLLSPVVHKDVTI